MARVADQGGKWIRPAKRLAIYRRDAWRCVYCGERPHRKLLTLDHVKPHGSGGVCDNEATNLVTACRSCNSAKGRKTHREFLAWLRKKGVSTEGIAARVRAATRKPIDRHLEWARKERGER